MLTTLHPHPHRLTLLWCLPGHSVATGSEMSCVLRASVSRVCALPASVSRVSARPGVVHSFTTRRPLLIRSMAAQSDTKLDKNTPDSKWKELLSAEEVLRVHFTAQIFHTTGLHARHASNFCVGLPNAPATIALYESILCNTSFLL